VGLIFFCFAKLCKFFKKQLRWATFRAWPLSRRRTSF
jgi:hypothetical protein